MSGDQELLNVYVFCSASPVSVAGRSLFVGQAVTEKGKVLPLGVFSQSRETLKRRAEAAAEVSAKANLSRPAKVQWVESDDARVQSLVADALSSMGEAVAAPAALPPASE